MKRRGSVLGLAGLAFLAIAAPAAGATRYASPTGTGPSGTCPPANPCNVEDAVESGSVMAGDEIVLLDGTYSLSSSLVVFYPVTIRPQNPGAVTITGSGSNNVNLSEPGATIQDLTIDMTPGSGARALDLIAGTGDRLTVIARGTSAIGAQTRSSTATIRNSVIRAPGMWGIGVVTGKTGATGGGRLVNDTVVATDTGVSSYDAYGTPQSVLVRNTIASGGTNDLLADGAGISVAVDHSSYDVGSASSGATITAGSGNLMGPPPAFANPAAGNFRVPAGAATIDAGVADPLTGSLDRDRRARSQDAAPDIGASELPQPPETTITSGPPDRTGDELVSFEFASSEPGSTFACVMDGAVLAVCHSGAAIGPLADGEHQFQVVAVDPDGNPDPTPASRSFEVDTELTGVAVRAKRAQRAGRKVRVKLEIAAGEDVEAEGAGTVSVGKRRYRLRPASKQVPAGGAKTLKLGVRGKRAQRRVRAALAAGKRARARVSVKVVDEVGNRAVKRRIVRLK